MKQCLGVKNLRPSDPVMAKDSWLCPCDRIDRTHIDRTPFWSFFGGGNFEKVLKVMCKDSIKVAGSVDRCVKQR